MNRIMLICIFLISQLSAEIINVPSDQPTIQDGINVSVDGDTVLVQQGTFTENINFNGHNITVASLFLTTQNTTYIASTIIDGNQNGSVVTFESGEDPNAVLCGFTLTNGQASDGGGIYCSSSSPNLQNLMVADNMAPWGGGIKCTWESSPILTNVNIISNGSNNGGGLHCQLNSSPILNYVTIMDNVGFLGGGVYCENSSPIIKNSIILNNQAENGGGIYCVNNSSPDLMNIDISNNMSSSLGGGIYCEENCNPTIIGCLISGNQAGQGGAMYFSSESNPILTNSTVVDQSYGGGICCNFNANMLLTNCIFWDNIPYDFNVISGSIEATYSDIQSGWAGQGNIDEIPLFAGIGDHPFILQDLSPCVNAGVLDTTGLNLPEFDLAGNLRIYGGRIDMGAYENQNVVGANENLIPLVTNLYQNYPNPFNPTTTISFSIPVDSKINLSVYNLKGQKVNIVVNNQYEKGNHSIIWNGEDETGNSVSSGIYYYKLVVNGKTEAVKKCLLLK
ncbi:right-handed parallel beta-helix repeat-containing protein [Candidatus Cloacimonadota bacterium]